MIRLKSLLTENTNTPLPAEQCLLDNGYKYVKFNGAEIDEEEWETQKTYVRTTGFNMKKKFGSASVTVHIKPGNRLILSIGSWSQILGIPEKYTFTGCSDLKQKIADEIRKVNQPKQTMPFTKLYKPSTKKNPNIPIAGGTKL